MTEDFCFTLAELDAMLEEKYVELAATGALDDVRHVVAIVRGGEYPGAFLAKKLPHARYSTAAISFYNGRELNGSPVVRIDEADQRAWQAARPGEVLVVDDLVDSGRTFVEFEKHYTGPPFKSFVIFKKSRAEYEPTYYCRETPHEQWIVFPPEIEL